MNSWLPVLVVILVVASVPVADAQDPAVVKNVIHAEVFAWGAPTLSYERILTPRFTVRAGVSAMGGGSFPVLVHYLVGGGSHRLEVGGGIWANPSPLNAGGLGTFGYRYQPRAGGLVLRGGWMAGMSRSGVDLNPRLVSVGIGLAF